MVGLPDASVKESRDRVAAALYAMKVSFERILESTPLTNSQQLIIRQLSSKENWSNRVQVKRIRLARTIADLDGKSSAYQRRSVGSTDVKKTTVQNKPEIRDEVKVWVERNEFGFRIEEPRGQVPWPVSRDYLCQ
ncbi:hypothetical protein ACOI1C_14520 [Bacillus sp. DJP31]|uniref:magnesium chelatase subunit ChlI family protein n=1 Tax=Bacillus sp. DJP31 TaxID=3409789 RepID=UPI003BB53C8D